MPPLAAIQVSAFIMARPTVLDEDTTREFAMCTTIKASSTTQSSRDARDGAGLAFLTPKRCQHRMKRWASDGRYPGGAGSRIEP